MHSSTQKDKQMKKVIALLALVMFMTSTLSAQLKAGKTDTTKHLSIYTCDHHPEVKSDKPGKCPKCGMDLKLSGKEQMKADVIKTYSCPVHFEVTSHDPGKCPKCGRKMNLSPKEQMKAEVMKTYTCPMHPEVALDKEGNCPKCGKPLVEKEKK